MYAIPTGTIRASRLARSVTTPCLPILRADVPGVTTIRRGAYFIEPLPVIWKLASIVALRKSVRLDILTVTLNYCLIVTLVVRYKKY
jgi:hypothetical protein